MSNSKMSAAQLHQFVKAQEREVSVVVARFVQSIHAYGMRRMQTQSV